MPKLLDREPTQEMLKAIASSDCAPSNYKRMFQSAYDAAPEVKQEPVGEMTGHHPVGAGEMPTILWRDGYWPVIGTKLYTFPPDAQAEIAKRDERIASLIAAGAEYQRQFFEQSDQIKELSEDRDTWKARTEFSFQQRDALAAQNQQLIDMIKQIIGHLNLYHLFSCVGGDSYDPECADLNIDQVQAIAHKALALTDLARPVLNRVKAEALRQVAEDQEEYRGGTPLLQFELRKMADAIEKGEGR